MNILGIDPGKGGGVCFKKGDYLEIGTMADIKEMHRYFLQCKEKGPMVCFIEKVQAWVGDAQDSPGKHIQVQKLLANYSQLVASLEIIGIPLVEVHPRSWQNHLRDVGVKKGDYKNPKNAYKAFAIQQYPMYFSKINLKTADAICITWYGHQMSATRPMFVRDSIKNKESLQLFN